MDNTNEVTPIEQLVANVLETRFEQIEPETVEHARNRIIDTLGCLIGGVDAGGNAGLVRLVKNWGGQGEATVLIHGFKAPAHNAAMVNCIMARSYDYEPVSPIVEGIHCPGHISGTTVPTAITMGEAQNASGKELITALLVGDNIAARLVAASGFGFDAGWDNIGLINSFGATAISGRLLKLNPRQLRNAFGIVLNQLAGSLQIVWDKTTTFKICNGLSARNSIFSAELARENWEGPKDAIFGKFGYYKLYTSGCQRPELLTQNLGKKYYSDGTIKPYPCCRINHAANDCALAIVRKYGINAQDIQEVTLFASREGINGFCGETFKIGDFPQANAIWSYRYNIATALLKKDVKPEHFTEEAIHDTKVHDFMKIINLAELPGADLYTTRLEVKMKDGKVLSESTHAPKGDPKNPMTKQDVLDKFWYNIDFSKKVSKKNAQKLLDLLENLENLDSVRKIVELLVVK